MSVTKLAREILGEGGDCFVRKPWWCPYSAMLSSGASPKYIRKKRVRVRALLVQHGTVVVPHQLVEPSAAGGGNRESSAMMAMAINGETNKIQNMVCFLNSYSVCTLNQFT